jgi:sterol 14-demethylase
MDLLVSLVAGQILRIAYYTTGILLVSIFLNVINQLVFYSRKEPPVVFHWVPFIGSTVAYGMDPYQFFFACRAKVSVLCGSISITNVAHSQTISTGMSSLSFC